MLKSFSGHEKKRISTERFLFLEQGLLCICKGVHIYANMYVYIRLFFSYHMICIYIYIRVYHPKTGLKMLFFNRLYQMSFFLNRFIASTLDEASDFGENNLSLCFLRF